MVNNNLESVLKQTEYYSRKNSFKGFDPYDALKSNFLRSFNNKYLRLISTQALVHSPLNVRNLLELVKAEILKVLDCLSKGIVYYQSLTI